MHFAVGRSDSSGPIVIRNEVMKTSSDCALMNLDDCDVTAGTLEVCPLQ
jgi:hypothetical protein